MNDKIIDVVGRTWRALGAQGEVSSARLARVLREDPAMVNLALGWLAREDKVRCEARRNTVMFALVDSELSIFRSMEQRASEAVKPGRRRLLKKILKRI